LSLAKFEWWDSTEWVDAVGLCWNGDINDPNDKGWPNSRNQGTWILLPEALKLWHRSPKHGSIKAFVIYSHLADHSISLQASAPGLLAWLVSPELPEPRTSLNGLHQAQVPVAAEVGHGRASVIRRSGAAVSCAFVISLIVLG
jgi:hypothetical protein